MIHYAAWPNWMVFVIIMAMVGPMMRFMFSGKPYPGPWGKRLRKQDTEDITRLDEAIAERDTVIEDLQRRLNEMESRLDFTERLLAERKEPLPTPR
jgi:uncharacterized coiled-coil protein SlyX